MYWCTGRNCFFFLTPVYRKPTFTGVYTRWNTFCPKQNKIESDQDFVSSDNIYFSKTKFSFEIEFIPNGHLLIFCNLEFLLRLYSLINTNCIIRKKCPVYLRLPWTNEICTSLKVDILLSVYSLLSLPNLCWNLFVPTPNLSCQL